MFAALPAPRRWPGDCVLEHLDHCAGGRHTLNYLQLTWSILLVAYPKSMLARSAARVTALIVISATLAGVAVDLWNAAQAPGDWVSYFLAACFVLLLLAWWLASRWARTRRA